MSPARHSRTEVLNYPLSEPNSGCSFYPKDIEKLLCKLRGGDFKNISIHRHHISDTNTFSMDEKTPAHHDEEQVKIHDHIAHDVDEIEYVNGEVLLTVTTDAKGENTSRLKLAKDGRTILIPQPTDDPNDPLNWSSFKKHIMLILVSFGSFAGDFGATSGIPAIILQSKQWNVTITQANAPNSINALMCGVSGIIWMPLLNSWGRMPVLFWSALLGLGFSIGAVLAPTYEVHYTMRVLQGVTQSTGQTIGLAFVQDCFFFHEHARKIGIWYAIYIASPFLGPLLGNIIIGETGIWYPIFWCVSAWSAMLICMILVFGDESYYNHAVPTDQQPPRKGGQFQRLTRVLGIWQFQHHRGYFCTVLSSYARLVAVFLKPVIPLTMVFYAAIFMWFIGLTLSSSVLLGTSREFGGYGLAPTTIGYIFFTPVTGVILGEAFGHWFNDYIAARYTRRHHGLFVPEVRLGTTFLGLALIVPGLVLVGQTLEHRLNVAGLVFGWGLDVFGVMITSVATIAFVLDCYPTASGEVSALINMARVSAGFACGYFEPTWTAKQGYGLAFGLQAVVVVAAFALVFVIQRFGARLRAWAGPVSQLKY